MSQWDEMSIMAANVLGDVKVLEKSYQQLLSGVRQAIATYHVNPKLHNELATTMCEFLEGKRK